MNQQQAVWKSIAVFIIGLIVSLPFYSANVYATAVSITKNSGRAQIDGFIDGQGDTWTVEAAVSQYPGPILPDHVKLSVNAIQRSFNSCNAGEGGAICALQIPLTDGLSDDVIPFSVFFYPGGINTPATRVSDSEVLNVDHSAPQVNSFTLAQKEKELVLSFTVTEKPTPCVGIQSIELVDRSGQTVYTVQRDFPQCSFSFNEVIPNFLEEAGLEFVKLRVRDRFGHETVSTPKRFSYDFAPPRIQPGVTFEDLDEFIGKSRKTTSMVVEIQEESPLREVKATSENLNFRGSALATCTSVVRESAENLWSCRWTNVEVPGEQSSVSAAITAIDEKGNSATTLVTKSFTPDTTAPEIVSLEAKTQITEQVAVDHLFNDVSYVAPGNVELFVTIRETGAGFSQEKVFADLTALGGANGKNPDRCSEPIGNEWICIWKVRIPPDCGGSDVCRVSAWAVDKVENEGGRESVDLHIDNFRPEVVSVEMNSIDGRHYFRSRDTLIITLKVKEENGVRVLVDVNDVLPAENAPVDGLALFSDANCERDTEEDVLVCTLEIGPIKSGPESTVHLPLTVSDVAGNKANKWPEPEKVKNLKGRNGDFSFELLGLDEETDPEFWEVSKKEHAIPFIDLDTTHLINTRMDFTVTLKPKTSGIEAKKIDLTDCQQNSQEGEAGPAVEVVRERIINTLDSKTPLIILEFEQFEGKEKFKDVLKKAGEGSGAFKTHELVYTCTLHILSKRGRQSIAQAEVQEVELRVPFGFSGLGAATANLDDLIKNAKKEMEGVWAFVGVLDKVVRILHYIVSAVSILLTAMGLWEGWGKPLTDYVQIIPGAGKAAQVAACFGLNTATKATGAVADKLVWVTSLLSCNYEGAGLSVLQLWGKLVLKIYNSDANALLGPLYKPATSVKDNLFLSLATGCIPGMVNAAKSWRETKCRYIYCLENEVKQGLATVSDCGKLESLLQCKYVFGELWEIVPLGVFYERVVNALEDVFSSWISLTRALVVVACGVQCSFSGALSGFCNISYYLFDILDFINSIIGVFKSIAQEFEDAGTGYCDAVGL